MGDKKNEMLDSITLKTATLQTFTVNFLMLIAKIVAKNSIEYLLHILHFGEVCTTHQK